MGKSWFSAVKKALSPEPKQKKEQVFMLDYSHFWLSISIKRNASICL
jgi:hypothetical protein